MKRFNLLIAFLLVITASLGAQVKAQIGKFEAISKSIKSEFAPDRREKVFEARLEVLADSSLVLKGSTTEKAAKDALLKHLAANNIKVADKMVLLPDPALEGKTYGITSQSVINFRYGPDYSEESATQTILGTPVRILERSGGWIRAITPEGYIAWVSGASIKEMDEAEFNKWKASQRLVLTTHYILFREEASDNSAVVMDGVWGNIVVKTGESGKWYKVMLQNGKSAFVPKSAAMDFKEWLNTRNITPESLVATGKQFMGFPYMWGGTSVKGVDCSGFTKSVYYLNGVILERDASQQALTGDEVDISNGYSNLKTGDLIFFGTKASQGRRERITHVGMYIGNGRFIHSSGYVHINSLYPADSDYNDVEKRVVRVKRVLTKIDADQGVVSVKNHPWYF